MAAPQKKKEAEIRRGGHPEDHMYCFRSVGVPKGMSALI